MSNYSAFTDEESLRESRITSISGRMSAWVHLILSTISRSLFMYRQVLPFLFLQVVKPRFGERR